MIRPPIKMPIIPNWCMVLPADSSHVRSKFVIITAAMKVVTNPPPNTTTPARRSFCPSFSRGFFRGGIGSE